MRNPLTERLCAGFHAIKSRTGPDGEVLSEESLQAEAARLRESLSTIDSRIDQARQELSRNTNAEEQDIWETNLVILQVWVLDESHLGQG